MTNRATRRKPHKLKEWPKHRPSPIVGIKISGGQRIWTCSCDEGWISITNEKPVQAHTDHVLDFLERNSIIKETISDLGLSSGST